MTSIIIPSAYDRGYYQAALESARNQTVECEIVKVTQSQTLAQNINSGLKVASGEFIKILPDDDLLEPDCLENLESVIGNNDFVFANAINFDGAKETIQKPLNAPVTLEKMLQKNQIHGGTVLYRKSALLAVGGMDESLWTAEEYDLHLRLMIRGFKWTYLDKVVFRYRLHGAQKSLGAPSHIRAKRKIEIKRIQDKHNGGRSNNTHL